MKNTKVIEQLKVLDNEVKLKILALLTESGAKSVTDISKQLNLNFSTAHKYLEQLEHAGFVRSKQEHENRLKRMFYIQDFYISLSPSNISKILKCEELDRPADEYGNFNIITDDGTLEKFDKFKFAKPYMDAGIPKSTIETVFNTIKGQVYNNSMLMQLKYLFDQELVNRVNIFSSAINKIKEENMHDNSIKRKLLLSDPSAIQNHINGNIFIQNLNTARLLSFVHDIRALIIHGISGKQPKDLDELFDNIITVINNEELQNSPQCLESFNYFIAPLANNLTDKQIEDKLSVFFAKLKSMELKIYIGLEFGVPKHLKQISPTFFKTKSSYLNYSEVAGRIFQKVTKLAASNKYNIRPVIKIHNGDLPKNIPSRSYVANMDFNGNKSNISFVGPAYFDSSWSGWLTTMRVGEIQNIAINLPAIAAQSIDPSMFSEKLDKLVDQIISYHLSIAEYIYAYSIRHFNITYPSVERGSWTYMHVNDFLYNISLYGLDLLHTFSYDELFIKEQLTNIQAKLEKASKRYRIRLALKQEQYPVVTNYFSHINRSKHKVHNIMPNAAIPERIQKFLDGGYVHRSNLLSKSLLSKHKLIRIEK